MSSPFKIFRKYQKVLLVVAGLMAMIAFVILPIISMRMDSTRRISDPVVVKTEKYGDLTDSHLRMLRGDHDRVIGALSAMTSKILGIDQQTCRAVWEKAYGSSKEEETVNRWLMTRKAEEIGIQVSDKSITDFVTNNEALLRAFLDGVAYDPALMRLIATQLQKNPMGVLSGKDFDEIFRNMGITEKQFYAMFKEVLTEKEFEKMFFTSLQGTPPAQRWDYYCRANRSAKIECIAVPVKDFADAVQKPSDDELKAYFEKYKGQLKQPYSPEPGFRIPQKIEVEYLKADLEKFATPENVTDEEIQAYYAKDPKTYDKMNQEALLREIEKSGEKKEADKDKPAEEKPKEGAQPSEGGAAPAGEKKEGETTPPATTEKPTEKPAEKTDGKTSSAESSPYRFASLQADENAVKTEPPKPETPAAKPETPATDSKPAETQPADAKPADSKPADAADQKPATEEAVKTPGDAKTEEPASPRRELTEDVKKLIRRKVAADKIKGDFEKIIPSMRENGKLQKAYNSAITRKETNVPKPPKYDFAGEAAKYGFSSGETGLVDKWQAVETEIGKTYIVNDRIPTAFRDAAFDMPKFMPTESEDISGNLYLFWKSKDEKETAPKWDDPAVQKQVLEAWRMEHARKAALAEAKRLADEANKAKASLKDVFADDAKHPVILPPAFSWMTRGIAGYGQLRQSTVEGVDLPGMDFMKAVFALEPMEVGTALNNPETIAYVVQVQKYEPVHKVLWQGFLEEDFRKYSESSVFDQNAAGIALIDQLKKDAGMKWERKPDQKEQEESANN